MNQDPRAMTAEIVVLKAELAGVKEGAKTLRRELAELRTKLSAAGSRFGSTQTIPWEERHPDPSGTYVPEAQLDEMRRERDAEVRVLRAECNEAVRSARGYEIQATDFLKRAEKAERERDELRNRLEYESRCLSVTEKTRDEALERAERASNRMVEVVKDPDAVYWKQKCDLETGRADKAQTAQAVMVEALDILSGVTPRLSYSTTGEPPRCTHCGAVASVTDQHDLVECAHEPHCPWLRARTALTNLDPSVVCKMKILEAAEEETKAEAGNGCYPPGSRGYIERQQKLGICRNRRRKAVREEGETDG